MNGGFGRMDRMHPIYGRNDIPPHVFRSRRNVPAAFPTNTLPVRAPFGASGVQRGINLGRLDPREAWVIAAMQNGLIPSSGVCLAPVPVGGTQLSSLRTPMAYDHVHRSLSSPSSSSDVWRPAHLPCSTNSSSCQSSVVGGYKFDTKDIVIRGKARVIRKSYLQESLKFESDLVKYLNTKSEEQVPERVVDLLIEFINADCYENFDVVDEVTLNILAFNVGAKSVVDFSLKRLKGVKELDSLAVLGSITATILMCSKVDSGLTEWLKKLLEKDCNAYASALVNSREYRLGVLDERPEVEVEIYRLLGLKQQPKDDNFRSL